MTEVVERKPYTAPKLLKRDARCVHAVFSEGGNLTPLQRIHHVPHCTCEGLSDAERAAAAAVPHVDPRCGPSLAGGLNPYGTTYDGHLPNCDCTDAHYEDVDGG